MASIDRDPDHFHMQLARLVAIAAITLLAAAGAEASAPPAFQLVFDGKHNAMLWHEGTFTTSSSWCSAGSAVDIAVDDRTLTAQRRFSCAGGGDFTAKLSPLSAEHGGSGSWQIVAGTGPLANLRGKGSFTSVRLSGDPNDPQTITFHSTWDGVADFDAAPPAIAVTSAKARKLKRPRRTYTIRLVLSLTDSGSDLVTYSVQIVDPKHRANTLAFKAGQTATGTAKPTLRIKVPKQTHAVRLKIRASDAVGNESALSKAIRLK